MGVIDTETKAYLSNAERFADIFNFWIYDGRAVIKSEELQPLDTSIIALPYANDEKQNVQKFRDVLKCYSSMKDGRAVYLILGIEAQTDVHYAMPVRNMLYDAMNYANQVSEISAAHRRDKTKLTKEEFLSGLHREDRLKPVITLVLSFSNEQWNGAIELHEMLDVEDRELLRFVPNYRLNLLTPANLSEDDFKKFQTGLGSALQVIKHKNDDDMSWMVENKRLESLDMETVSLINAVAKTNIKYDEGEETINMWKAWENSKKQEFERGMNFGQVELMHKLITNGGMSFTDIMDKAGIPVEDRQQYQAALDIQ